MKEVIGLVATEQTLEQTGSVDVSPLDFDALEVIRCHEELRFVPMAANHSDHASAPVHDLSDQPATQKS